MEDINVEDAQNKIEDIEEDLKTLNSFFSSQKLKPDKFNSETTFKFLNPDEINLHEIFEKEDYNELNNIIKNLKREKIRLESLEVREMQVIRDRIAILTQTFQRLELRKTNRTQRNNLFNSLVEGLREMKSKEEWKNKSGGGWRATDDNRLPPSDVTEVKR